jgi:hypothetical protein
LKNQQKSPWAKTREIDLADGSSMLAKPCDHDLWRAMADHIRLSDLKRQVGSGKSRFRRSFFYGTTFYGEVQ